mgnify:CR=1 FL=1
MPVEPPPCPWAWPDPRRADEHGVVGVGADLEPGTLLAAYRAGLFPMPVGRRQLAWFSPDPRGVLPLDAVHVSRSLRRSRRRFECTVDTAFRDVMVGCATGREDGDWITRPIVDAYVRLHELGWAHSVEVWTDDELVGGLYARAIIQSAGCGNPWRTVADAHELGTRFAEALGCKGEEIGRASCRERV